MHISGKANEGWMTLLPATVLILVVMAVMGGPTAFVNTLGLWATEVIASVATWLKYL